MVMHLFIGLILISAASAFITQGKRRKIWSILLLVALGGMSCMFIHNPQIVGDSGFMYQWLPYPKLQADFNISASLRMQQMLTPLIYLLAALIVLNIIDTKENYSLNISVLNLLSFIMIILLASSHDLFQLMFASALLSILCFYITENAPTRHKFFMYNFLAEMSCFIALSIVYSSVGSISLNTISFYTQKLVHKDFIAFLLLFSLSIKSGLIILNGQYSALSGQSFNRLCSIFILSLPFSSLILLAKLSPLINIFAASHLVEYWCLLTFVFAVFSVLIYNNLNRKIIAIAQMFYAFIFYAVFADTATLYSFAPKILATMFLSMGSVYYLAVTSYRSSDIYHGIAKYIFILVCFSAIFGTINTFSLSQAQIFGTYCFAAVCGVIIRMLNNKIISDLRIMEDKNNFGFFLVVVTSLVVLYLNGWDILLSSWKLWLVFLVFVLIPPRIFFKIGNISLLNHNIVEYLYQKTIVLPLKFFGRILWLAFVFMFIEKGVIGSASSLSELTSERLRNLQNSASYAWLGWLLFGLIGVVIFAGVYIYD